MRNLLKILCILSLVSCAPSRNTSDQSVAIEEAGARKLDSCAARSRISGDVKSPWTESSIDVDSSFENYIVKYKEQKSGLEPSGHEKREFGVSGLKLRSISGSMYSLHLTGSTEEKQAALSRLAEQSDVDYVEPDYPIKSTPVTSSDYVPDDPYFSKQWFHKNLQSLSAWKVAEGSDDIVVAVIDTGIDYTHPDLADNVWVNKGEIPGNGIDDDNNGYIDDINGWNFAANSNDARSTAKSPHGSHVAGLIGASGNNHIGVVGVAPKVKMMALKFMDDSGSGITSNAVKAIDYAIKKKVFLINNSWGSNQYSKALSDAITRAAKANILFFAAAGNGFKGNGYDIIQKPWYPASYSQWNVFSIAATTQNDQLTQFSNFAKNKVDVAAPGNSMFSTVSGTQYQMMSGTSMATPVVSGLAVLIKATNPKLDPAQILNIIRDSSDPVPNLYDKVISGGRVNSYRAVQMATNLNYAHGCGR